eukprot:TRINITY_DN1588_c0_g1_i2.p1 TRINITY_DN1588_c0_g1~~TRINITY_DN1588_c0_g1_i2.p1  ORF type:complete len:381 (+),score=57.11 TRINITY_DN1588_c0_g1_i2:52-1194(+)
MRRYCAVLALAACAAGLRKPLGPHKRDHVSDDSGFLHADGVERINGRLSTLAREVGPQVAVAVIDHLPDGKTEKEHAHDVFNTWGLGRKDKNDGVLLLVSINDRRLWILPGLGIRDVLTPAKATSVFNEMKPQLRAGEYTEAVAGACDRLDSILRGEEHGSETFHTVFTDDSGIVLQVMIIFAFVLMIMWLSARVQQRRVTEYKKRLDRMVKLKAEGFGEGDLCGVCLDDLSENKVGIVQLRCGHGFHRDCIEQWLKRKNNCPICRAKDPTNPDAAKDRDRSARGTRRRDTRSDAQRTAGCTAAGEDVPAPPPLTAAYIPLTVHDLDVVQDNWSHEFGSSVTDSSRTSTQGGAETGASWGGGSACGGGGGGGGCGGGGGW